MTSMTDTAATESVPMAEPTPAEAPATGPVAVPGPEDRIRAFVETEQRRVVAAVSLWTGSFDDAIDAVTDALGRAWERLDRGGTIDNLAGWVTHAAMNQIRSRHRRRRVARRNRHLIAVVDTHDDTVAHRADVVDLGRALGQLTNRQRDVVALHYAVDLPVAEIASTLGIAPGTVKATLHQARTRLAELLGDPTPRRSFGSSDRNRGGTTAHDPGVSDD